MKKLGENSKKKIAFPCQRWQVNASTRVGESENASSVIIG